jgi:GntR family transcriptional regulator/MocR family aminotransferase
VTVVTAYKQLAAEGFVVLRPGAGTFVADLPLLPTPRDLSARALSPWAQRALALSVANGKPRHVQIDFGFGRTFPQHFPYDTWRKLLARYLSTDDVMLARYGSPAGFQPLRVALAAHLRRVRGVNCAPEQVIIVSGVQQAIDIIARLLIRPGDEVLVETPGYMEAYNLLRVYGAVLHGLPVDDEGFPVERIPPESAARLAFVTPANQFPHGGTLTLERRLWLLAWARRADAYILEDDYDGELRYDGHSATALQGIDDAGRVIYLGTFSKVLFPALRLAYVVLPTTLIPPFLATKRLIDRGSPTLTQAAIGDFMAEGYFDRHLHQLRETYGRRRALLATGLQQVLGERVHFSAVAAGLHIMVQLPTNADEAQLIQRAAEQFSLGLYPAAPYHLQPGAPPAILLGFSGVREEDIAPGVAQLAQLLTEG